MSPTRDPPEAGDEAGDPDDSRGDGPHDRPNEFEARALLSGSSPRVVLARLVDGDPLELWPRSIELLRERWILADVQHVCLRTAARVAYASMRYRGRPPLSEWLAGLQAQALEEVLEEERELESAGSIPDDAGDRRYDFLSSTLGIEAPLARRACVAFNALEDDVRRVYYGVVVEQKGVKRYAADSGEPRERVRAALQRALDTIERALRSDHGTRGGAEELHG